MTIQDILEDVRKELTVKNEKLNNAINSIHSINNNYPSWIEALQKEVNLNSEKMVCINDFLEDLNSTRHLDRK